MCFFFVFAWSSDVALIIKGKYGIIIILKYDTGQ